MWIVNVQTPNFVCISLSECNSQNKKTLWAKKNDFIQTVDEDNSWIQIDYKERTVILDSYTLKSVYIVHLKNCTHEALYNWQKYQEIDRHGSSNILNYALQKASLQF